MPRRSSAHPDAAANILTPFDLMDAPQLAALQLLEAAFHVTSLALLAAHAELIDPDYPHRGVDPAAPLAARLLRQTHDICLAIRAYRRALTKPPPSTVGFDDIPF